MRMMPRSSMVSTLNFVQAGVNTSIGVNIGFKGQFCMADWSHFGERVEPKCLAVRIPWSFSQDLEGPRDRRQASAHTLSVVGGSSRRG